MIDSPRKYGIAHDEWREHQPEAIEWTNSIESNGILEAPTGCHAKGQGILMFDGTIKPVENIVVGDRVMGMNGSPRTVHALHSGRDAMYEIRPVKGKPFVVNHGHILSLMKTRERSGPRDSKRSYSEYQECIVDVSLKEYLEWSDNKKRIHKLFRSPVDFSKKSVLRTGFTVVPIGEGDYYGFGVDGDCRYLLDDFTVTHNSGKTAIARVAAHNKRIVALMRTKALQAENYEQEYNFVPLYGKGNYPCVHPSNRRYTCADCLFDNMTECNVYSSCEYILARDAARESQRAALNYAYWLHSYHLWPFIDMLVCDEGHQLSDVVLEWAGCSISNETRLKWDLPIFPMISGSSGGGAFHKTTPPETLAEIWLKKVEDSLEMAGDFVQDRNDAEELLKMQGKVKATLSALSSGVGEWFIRSGPAALQTTGGATWGFVARPLTARHHFNKYFTKEGRRLLIMSATIGNFDTFSIELGLMQPLEFYRVPSVWHPKTRPIRALDVPRIGRSSSPSAYAKQEDAIAEAIKSVDPRWSGLIHVTSKSDARRLTEALSKRGLHKRMYMAKELGTNRMVADWNNRKSAVPNSILVSWAFWEGYNGLDERINIVAKMPYPFLGSQYEVERRNYDGKFFLQRTAWQLQQGLGRTRRGRTQDYDTNGEVRGLVAIADGQWKYLRNYMSADLLESII